MPRRRGRPNPPRVEWNSFSEETESSPSPPRRPRNDRNPGRAPNPRRQPVERLGPPRPVVYNTSRQMTRLDVNREVQLLERARQQQPESFGIRPASALPAEVASQRGFAGPRPIPTLEEVTRRVDQQRLRVSQLNQERREMRGRANVAICLSYEDARNMSCIWIHRSLR